MSAMGKALVLEPFLSSAVIGAALARELGAGGLLEEMAAGTIAVPAHAEARETTTARRGGKGWILRGRKAVVSHAPMADLLLVSASAGDGFSVFAVPRRAAAIIAYPTVDGHRAADVVLDDVDLPPDALLGPPGGAQPAIEAAYELGVAALCAEASGVLQATLDATVAYTRERKQFGVPIGTFQALQHRMADMLMHVEQARSMAYLAMLRGGRREVSAAKVLVGQACRFVGQQAIQLHGGMGVTNELPVAHLVKRLVAIELSFGDTDHHLERFIAAGP
jgi:alkylation response protein AidB-like acyl-CoA dehydrogenase